MAQVNVKDITAQIKKREFHNIYYLYGRNVSGVEGLTKLLVKNIVGDATDFALTKINGKDLNISEFRDVIEMLPMMCEYNCILINDYNCEEQRDETTKSLIAVLKEVPQQTVVIFNITGFDVKNGKKTISAKNKKLTDFISKNGIICEQELKTPSELAKSIVGAISKRGCEISIQTAQELAVMCLSNTLMINNEIEKLCAYADGKVIDSEMLRLMVAQQSDITVYSLANAVSSFNKKAAFDALDELMAQRIGRGAILNAISSSFMDLYRASIAKKKGRTSRDMMKDFDYIWEFKVQNAFRDCSKMSVKRLRSCIEILRDTAVTLNTTAADERIMLEKTITAMLMTKN